MNQFKTESKIMTISVKPEDIESPEAILHFCDEYPNSGQNRAAAKLIRSLLAAAPPVNKNEITTSCQIWRKGLPLGPMPILYTDTINGDTVLRDDVWLATTEQLASSAPSAPLVAVSSQYSDEFKSFHRMLCKRFGYTHDEAFWWRDQVSLMEFIAGQVAPQATVDDSKFWPVDMSMSRNQMCVQIGQMNYRLTALREENEGLVRKNAKLRAPLQATVEPLTHQQVFDKFSFLEGVVNEAYYKKIAETAIALLAATPPTSNATEPNHCNSSNGSFDISSFKAWADSHGGVNLELAKGYGDVDTAGRYPATFRFRETETAWRAYANVATSKADTGEPVPKAVLDALVEGCAEAFARPDSAGSEDAEACSHALGLYRDWKSATPSTIKEEPTGEQL